MAKYADFEKSLSGVRKYYYANPQKLFWICAEYHELSSGRERKRAALQRLLPEKTYDKLGVANMGGKKLTMLAQSVLEILPVELEKALNMVDISYPIQLEIAHEEWGKNVDERHSNFEWFS